MEKYEYPEDSKKREVLRRALNDSFQTYKLAQNIEKHCKRFGQYIKGNDTTLRWILNNDNIGSFDYTVPIFKMLSFKIHSKKESQWKTFDDKIQSFTIKINGDNDIHTEEEIKISKNDETETTLEFFSEIKKNDPDIIIAANGDQILFPYFFTGQKLTMLQTN